MFIYDCILDSAIFTNLLVIIASAVIVYFAWKSTNVREDRITAASVFIFESFNRQRNHLLNQVIGISEENEEIDSFRNLSIPESPIHTIIDEVNDITSLRTTTRATNSNSYQSEIFEPVEDIRQLFQETDFEHQRIIEVMNNSNRYLLTRRVATNNDESSHQSSDNIIQSGPIVRENLNIPTSDNNINGNTVDNFHADNCSNENNENENKAEFNNKQTVDKTVTCANDENTETKNQDDEKEFRIKLKYLNDDLKLVKGSPNEAIGDFKKRNFTIELADEKIIRLVFNGQVLQPDSKTLKACGLFDNCVVHCLVCNKKSPSSTANRSSGSSNSNNSNISENESNRNNSNDHGTSTFRSNEGRGVSFVYFVILFSGLSIILAWYCRFTYSFVFSWYSTIALGIMTIIFLALSPVLILIEREVSL